MAQQFDTSVPNIARVYDFWLGGKDNFAADRELAAQLTALYPPIAQMIWDNRQFLARAVGWVARQGISQFIDLGPGLPTSPSTHEAARAVTSGTTVAYVDFDPLVVSHLDALVANGQDGIVVMAADVRDRDAVLNAPDLAGYIDLSQPACLVMGAVLHFLDAAAAAELAASYTRLLAPGSYVVITVGRGDGEVADRFFSMYRAAARMHSHSLDQFATFFQGLEMVPPGLLLAGQWQPGLRHVRPVPKRPGEVLAGVGKVPGPPLHGALRRAAGSRTGIRHPVRQTGVPDALSSCQVGGMSIKQRTRYTGARGRIPGPVVPAAPQSPDPQEPMIPPLDTGEEHRVFQPASWMPSTGFQAIHVGGEQPAACRVPFRVRLPGLGEHRSEDDDIAWSNVLANRAVGTATGDDPLQGVVDLVAHREGFRHCNRQPAMQRQHEFVSLGDP